MTGRRILCRLADIEDGGAKGFYWGEGTDQRSVFVLREGARIRGYVNSCPHLGTPLEFLPDRFISADGDHILCSTHGALFQIADGLCVSGPCVGERLMPVEVMVDDDGRVVLRDGKM